MTKEHQERMAKAVSFVMLGVDDRWKDWLPEANEIIAQLAVKVGIAAAPLPPAGEESEDGYTDEDMAAVGRSLMETLRINCPKWSPADDPAEIVVDLMNALYDVVAHKAEPDSRFIDAAALSPPQARVSGAIDEQLAGPK